jgi:hypothetical protein
MARHTQEIERKWLVQDLPGLGDLKYEQIIQGYLAISSDGAGFGSVAKATSVSRP